MLREIVNPPEAAGVLFISSHNVDISLDVARLAFNKCFEDKGASNDAAEFIVGDDDDAGGGGMGKPTTWALEEEEGEADNIVCGRDSKGDGLR